jgi:hypothetical protein
LVKYWGKGQSNSKIHQSVLPWITVKP